MSAKKEHDDLRRLAMQISIQLPSNTADYMTVIGHLTELVAFLEGPALPSSNNVKAFPASRNSR